MYGWAPDSLWGTDPLFVKTGGSYYWYQNDHLGTSQKIIRTNGSIAWAATYDSFGNAQIITEEITNNLRFAGQYYDAETGLHYNRFRYYDPITGRYLRTDPYWEGLNLYTYCFGNPLYWIDPYGLCVVKQGWNWWSDVSVTTGDYWIDKSKEFNQWIIERGGLFPGSGPDWHRFRNTRQRYLLPETNKNMDGWTIEGNAALHGGNLGYLTYRKPHGIFGGLQATYDTEGNLVIDPLYAGTYDYVSPFNVEGELTVPRVVGHGLVDVLPYYLFGN